MSVFEDLLKKMPKDSQAIILALWQSLSPADKKNLLNWANGLPTETALMRTLLTMSASHLRGTFGSKHRVAIVGPANVGKSTLYNQLVTSKADHAKVSPVPGTTRENQLADTGLFAVVDTPGADQIGTLGEAEHQQAFAAANGADFLVIMFDPVQGIKASEVALFERFRALGKPFIIVLNKIDLVRKDQEEVLQSTAAKLQVEPEQVIPISARDGQNIEQVVLAIAVSEPGLVAALGEAFPEYRWKLAYKTITNSATIAAAIALTPLPFLDFAPLLITQTTMVLGIARIYNYKINFARARELVVTFGVAFLGRTLFYELSKLSGVPGWILSVAIAASTTVAMGYAAAIWFERGEKLSNNRMKAISKAVSDKLILSLKGLVKGKKNKEAIKDIVKDTLSDNIQDPIFDE